MRKRSVILATAAVVGLLLLAAIPRPVHAGIQGSVGTAKTGNAFAASSENGSGHESENGSGNESAATTSVQTANTTNASKAGTQPPPPILVPVFSTFSPTIVVTWVGALCPNSDLYVCLAVSNSVTISGYVWLPSWYPYSITGANYTVWTDSGDTPHSGSIVLTSCRMNPWANACSFSFTVVPFDNGGVGVWWRPTIVTITAYGAGMTEPFRANLLIYS